MNKFQPIQYIKKYSVLIIIFFITLTAGLYMLLQQLQSYTARVVIEYVYNEAKNGLSPDGSKLDVSGIYSSNVINTALDNLELDQGKYPIDMIRSSITVTQIEDEEVTAVKEALNSEGESSDLQSTRYEVTYRVKGGEAANGEELARTLLDEILDVYFTQFSEQYINKVTATNSTSDINLAGFDYIEQMELIAGGLQETINNLNNRVEADPGFYSVESGYSFNELLNEFNLLYSTQVSSVYSYVLNHQVTKDKAALLSKYLQRVQSYEFDKTQYTARVDEVEKILDAYVEKLRQSNNTAQSESAYYGLRGGNVLGDVESPNYTNTDDEWVAFDQTTEYEELLKNWINSSDAYNAAVIDAAYCQYIIDCFAGNDAEVISYQEKTVRIEDFQEERAEAEVAEKVDGTEGLIEAEEITEQAEASIFTQPTVACTAQDIAYVEEKIDSILSRMNELYDIIRVTDAEYNEYLGAEYIQMISSNHVAEGVNVLLYTALGAVLFLVIGCLGVILLGRLGDMVEYIAFIDHQYRLPNRVACDRYIQNHKDKVLPTGFGCLFLQVTNQKEINRLHGRQGGDDALVYFTSSMKEIFGEAGNFVGYNGGNQFMVFVHNTDYTSLQKLAENFKIVLHEHFKELHITFKYTVGISETNKDDVHLIRELISKATTRKEQYEAGAENVTAQQYEVGEENVTAQQYEAGAENATAQQHEAGAENVAARQYETGTGNAASGHDEEE